MSLITQQCILQAQSDHDDALRLLAVGEDTQRVRDLLSGATKRLTKFQKQLTDEKAKADSQRKAEHVKEKVKKSFVERRPMGPEDLDLTCGDCASAFPFTGKDQVFFEKQGWTQPSRCVDCRTVKKNIKPSGKELSCEVCEGVFLFSDGKARIFEEKGWAEPKRCHDCTVAHKSMVPLLIHCSGCAKDFSFSVKKQKDFKAKGWTEPKRCHDCNAKKGEVVPEKA